MSAAIMTTAAAREEAAKPAPAGPSTAESAPAVVKPKRRRAPLVFGGLLLAAAAAAGILYVTRLGKESTDDAQVEGHVSSVSSRISGQVKRVLVNDNEIVKAAQVLVELDDRDQQARLTAARADLAAANAQLRAAQTQLALTEKTAKANLEVARGGIAQASAVSGSTQAVIDQAKADIAGAESRKQLARLDRERSQRLVESGAVPRSELDVRIAADEQADAAVAQARARLVTAMAGRSNSDGTVDAARGRLLAASTVDEQLEAARAQVALAEAHVAQVQSAFEQANLNLEYTKVKAEFGGVVSRRTVEDGQMVSPDRPLMAIVDLEDTWVVANLKETQLKEIKAGQKAEVKVDTYDGTMTGHVDSIAAGTGSRFSLLPADNASGNFTKVTQRVPVLIRLDDRGGKVLRPGMSAEVTIFTK
jgi:membrane fusion protein (multidrug efflux system)